MNVLAQDASHMPNHNDSLIQLIAPSGTLRVAINLGNPILASQNAQGQPEGVSVDIAQELAKRLGAPIEFVVVEKAMQSVQAVTQGRADVGFFAIDPARSEGVGFTKAYVQIEGSYLVADASPLTSNEQVDRDGTRVVVGQGSAYDLFLTRHLKHAEIVRAESSPAVVDYFVAHQLDVAAGVKQQLEADAKRLPHLRLLPGRFMVIHQAMGLPLGRSQAAQQWLTAFVDELRANGFVQQALERHGVQGATVAPATP
jgi:polar amino acid transport system substrate-binding protein